MRRVHYNNVRAEEAIWIMPAAVRTFTESAPGDAGRCAKEAKHSGQLSIGGLISLCCIQADSPGSIFLDRAGCLLPAEL